MERASTTPKDEFKGGWTCRFPNWAARQSAAAAAALAGLPIDALYASPLRRAMETAEIIADALGLPIQTDLRLMEIDVGVFQDKRPCELAELCPEALARWKSEDLDFVIPGGESRRQVIARGRAALEAIAATGLQAAIIVAHGRLLTSTLKDTWPSRSASRRSPCRTVQSPRFRLTDTAATSFSRWIRSIICAARISPAWAICRETRFPTAVLAPCPDR